MIDSNAQLPATAHKSHRIRKCRINSLLSLCACVWNIIIQFRNLVRCVVRIDAPHGQPLFSALVQHIHNNKTLKSAISCGYDSFGYIIQCSRRLHIHKITHTYKQKKKQWNYRYKQKRGKKPVKLQIQTEKREKKPVKFEGPREKRMAASMVQPAAMIQSLCEAWLIVCHENGRWKLPTDDFTMWWWQWLEMTTPSMMLMTTMMGTMTFAGK